MPKHRRDRKGKAGLAVFAILALAGATMLTGCEGLKRAVGLSPVAPNEFEVESQAPLTVPPDFALRPPQPGQTRPQGRSPQAQAQQAMEQAGAGKPVKKSNQRVYSGGAAGVMQVGAGAAPASGTIASPGPRIAAGSLAQKLLDYSGGGAGGTIDKRETTPLKGVH